MVDSSRTSLELNFKLVQSEGENQVPISGKSMSW
jgi:hypothetical protein